MDLTWTPIRNAAHDSTTGNIFHLATSLTYRSRRFSSFVPPQKSQPASLLATGSDCLRVSAAELFRHQYHSPILVAVQSLRGRRSPQQSLRIHGIGHLQLGRLPRRPDPLDRRVWPLSPKAEIDSFAIRFRTSSRYLYALSVN